MEPLAAIALLAFGIIALGGLGASCASSTFTYRQKSGVWRAYFNSEPPSRTHVLHDSDGYYVCWDMPLRTEADARRVAEHWMKTYGKQ